MLLTLFCFPLLDDDDDDDDGVVVVVVVEDETAMDACCNPNKRPGKPKM